ncbi:amino acid transporter [Eremomyces bilateralis CBS 781.70]|uniref:Amino acid transporter n=1 Tax=Eremomyces bilateralis CBS 781.70 TaxID=1392243 RepID=A0A6G1FRP5_9PEZI|nr:amino acid transporter [Eremomyces bilateralis CBS 781.70]KAF1808361.1 amino acid transporter [Eremomyces bilateralis CBS 781.70]
MSSSSSPTAEQEPLLQPVDSPNSDIASYNSTSKSSIDEEEAPRGRSNLLDRSVENDVLPETAVLGRNLGWSSAYILIMSRVIGSGIFATPGAIVQSVGSFGITLLLWVVGALIAWLGLAISLEYGCMLPRSGGDKVYLEFVYRRPRFLASVLIAVRSVLLGFTASNCIVFGEYILYALKREPSQAEGKVLALGLLTTVVIIHSCFLKTGILIQNVLGWIKIALAIFMLFISLFVVLFRRNEDINSASQLTINNSSIWDGSVWNWGIISTAMFKVSYSYTGLSNVNNVLNEVKNPVKTLKSAATAALITSCLLYLLVNIAYFLVVPIEDIKHSGELIAALFFERVFGPDVGRVLLPLAIATSAAGNVMVVTFSHARVVQEIARQGFLPFSQFISSSKPFGAPMGALITHYIPSFLVIIIPATNIYSFILDVEGYPGQFFAIAGSVGLIWLRFKMPDLRRPYKAFLPAVGFQIVHSISVIFAPFIPREGLNWRQHLSAVSYAFVGTAILLFGVLYWYIWTVWIPRRNGCTLEETVATLGDGTTVTKLVWVPIGSKPVPTTEQGAYDE